MPSEVVMMNEIKAFKLNDSEVFQNVNSPMFRNSRQNTIHKSHNSSYRMDASIRKIQRLNTSFYDHVLNTSVNEYGDETSNVGLDESSNFNDENTLWMNKIWIFYLKNSRIKEQSEPKITDNF